MGGAGRGGRGGEVRERQFMDLGHFFVEPSAPLQAQQEGCLLWDPVGHSWAANFLGVG